MVVVATGAEAGAPVVGAGDAAERRATSATCSRARAQPTGDVVVIDELGFHHATSVAELLADRGCAVEVVTPGMVVGQDLGITLDMEDWWMRAGAKGIVQSTELVPMGMADGRRCSLLHHPTGDDARAPARLGRAAPCPPHPVEGLYLELRDGERGVEVERVGDCVAPRRAHAAVIDGERVGAAI